MERHHHVMVFFVPFGAGLGISFSQTRASHNKRDGFGRKRATFGDQTISVASYSFKKSSVNIEQQECCVQFWNFSGFVWTFYTLTGFPRHFMRIIQIWTTCTCSSAYKLVENQICVLGFMLRSHARNGNEFQTPRHLDCWQNIWMPGF